MKTALIHFIFPVLYKFINKQHRLIKKNIPFVLISLVIFFFVTTELLGYSLVMNFMLASLKSNEMLKIQQAGDELDQWLANLRVQVEFLANTSYVRSVNWAIAEPYLQLELQRSPGFYWFTLIKPDGTYYNTRKGYIKGFNLKRRAYFKNPMMQGLTDIDDPVIGYSNGMKEIHISAPIWSFPQFNSGQLTAKISATRIHSLATLNLPTNLAEKPHTIGVLAGTIDVGSTSQLVEKIRAGNPGSYAFVLNSRGKIIIGSDNDLLVHGNTFIDKATSSISEEITSHKQGIELVEIFKRKWFYIAYLPLKQVKWSILLVVPQENLNRQLFPLNLLVSVIFTILLVTFFFAINFIKLFKQTNLQTEKLNQSYKDLQLQTEKLNQAYKDLQSAQTQLVHAEKMSSLGQLVAGIAHEINNPISFICGNITPITEYTNYLVYLLKHYQENYSHPVPIIQAELETGELDFIIEDIPKILNSLQVGVDRVRGIVLSLRTFSRLDEADVKKVNIHDGIDSTLMILQNRLKAKSDRPEIKVIKEYGQIPLMECYAGQMNQVFMNIFANAIDALEVRYHQQPLAGIKDFSGLIIIRTEYLPANLEIGSTQDSYPTPVIIICIIDNGSGISQENQSHIFNPFFTTKDIGKGTGLGLSISYQIVVERHGGKLECYSTLCKGTEFKIIIPISQ